MNDKLMQSLLNAKKVMNKVESGNFEKGNVNKDFISKDPDELMASGNIGGNMPALSEGNIPKKGGNYIANVNESKLPESIKKAMLENPIALPEVNLTNSLSLDFTDKVAKQMEKQGLKRPSQQQQRKQQVNENYSQSSPASSLNESIIREMKPLIKEIIQSTLESMIEKVLTEKLAEKTTKMNENLQIRVGDSIFVGKIIGVKQVKK